LKEKFTKIIYDVQIFLARHAWIGPEKGYLKVVGNEK
jgi:hypothetical protein